MLACAGSVQTQHNSLPKVVTWPIAAAQLMTASPYEDTTAAPPVSPVSSGSIGALSNKRRKLGTLDPPPGLLLGSRARQTSHVPFHFPRSTADWCQAVPNAELDDRCSKESDAETDVSTPAVSGKQYKAAAADVGMHTAQSSDLPAASGQQLPHVAAEVSDVEVNGQTGVPGEEHGHQSSFVIRGVGSPGDDSDGLPFQVTGDKGKGVADHCPCLEYLPEQPSTLDHTQPGSWVWGKIDDATWLLVQVQHMRPAHCAALPFPLWPLVLCINSYHYQHSECTGKGCFHVIRRHV